MGVLNVVISTVGKCLEAVCLLLDVNFLLVHTIVRTFLAVLNFITNLPSLFIHSLLELGNMILFGFLSTAEATSYLAHGTVNMLGSLMLSMEGLLESLKMVGYLVMHVLLRGKEHLCRGLLTLQEVCGIALSLLVYLVNTAVNYTLIATLNLHSVVLSVWQTVSSPLQMALELTLTSITFLYSSLAGTSAFLWSPCKLLLDFLASLVHIFISIFILNIYGLLLTVSIALTTTAYLNPELTRQASRRLVSYANSFPAIHRLHVLLCLAWHNTSCLLCASGRHLHRMLRYLHLLERRIWRQLSRHSSQLGTALRTQLHGDNTDRVRGDGDPDEGTRRDPPDGRAGDHNQPEHLAPTPSSTERPLKANKRLTFRSPSENVLTLHLCVICHDHAKTVVLLPCRHLCLCRRCTDILLQQPVYQHNCPLCRRMILNTIEVYL
ncbi:E3 ubiquitin-protein ligase RNF26 [Dunckerocampus dactyliophorus]|uniref:E3 ubiquitin-protein ligase RNF26 n=1 Tax=Dunckerocampus dactyliophorus TaxID=161453 RepID=UPI0024072B2B|nr:E3 ubiquitin-protein ligase RNF26 [Dunckerocampus dactyliophorus]